MLQVWNVLTASLQPVEVLPYGTSACRRLVADPAGNRGNLVKARELPTPPHPSGWNLPAPGNEGLRACLLPRSVIMEEEVE